MLFVCKLLLNSPPQPLLLTRPLPEDARSFACRAKLARRQWASVGTALAVQAVQLHQHMLGGCKEWTDPTDWRRNRRTALRVSPLHLSCTCLRRPHPLQLQTQPPTCSSPASIKGTTRTRPIVALHLS